MDIDAAEKSGWYLECGRMVQQTAMLEALAGSLMLGLTGDKADEIDPASLPGFMGKMLTAVESAAPGVITDNGLLRAVRRWTGAARKVSDRRNIVVHGIWVPAEPDGGHVRLAWRHKATDPNSLTVAELAAITSDATRLNVSMVGRVMPLLVAAHPERPWAWG